MGVETRSQHQQAYPHQPSLYPQISSPSTSPTTQSVFQSPSGLSSISSSLNTPSRAVPQASPNMLSQQSSFAAATSAPLSSPAAGQQTMNYFGAMASSNPAQTSHPQVQAARIASAPRDQMAAASYLGQRGGDGGGTPETAPFLKDFNLVAEAAKRAQMACLARDLGDVGL